MAFSAGFPIQTTSGQGLFNGPSSKGYIVGQSQPSPASRYELKGGIVDSSETLPMFGGVGIYADVPSQLLSVPLPAIGRANSMTGSKALVGFTVIDQTYNAIIDPANPVPTVGTSQTIGFYTLGSRARLAVACDPSIISLSGGLINQQVSWDFTTQQLIPFSAAYPQTNVTNAVWAATNGGQITFTVGTDLTSFINAGDDIEIANVVNTGGTSTTAFNGQWTVLSITSGSIVVSAPAGASLGTFASAGIVVAGGGALPVTILDVLPTGNMVPVFSAATGLRTWNYSGAAALIQLTGGTVA